MSEAAKPGVIGKFMGRWGWPIMGVLAAAPVLAHALDWRTRTKVKQRMEDERKRQAELARQRAYGIVPTGEDVYKAAAYHRELLTKKSAVEKLNELDDAIKAIRG